MNKLRKKYLSILNKKERLRIKREMAEQFGLSKVTIAAWLCGVKTPNERYHAAIAAIFGCSVNEIFGEDGTE